MKTILTINGSDSMGHSGIQADIRTIRDLGGYAATAVTSVTVQNQHGITDVHELPAELVAGQIRAIYEEAVPQAIKVGMVNDAETIRFIREEIVGCKVVVSSPVILSSLGGCLMNNEAIHAFMKYLLPVSTLLIVKSTDAEIMLGRRITTDQEMIAAARELQSQGAKWVLLRGGTYVEGRISALLLGEGYQTFFSSVNISGWQRHGVGGTLSTAICVQMAMSDDVLSAIEHAHNYLHNQVVYTINKGNGNLRPNDLYNSFLTIVSSHYKKAHEVAFYAERLNISTRYLSQITNSVSGSSPKQIIDNHILYEAERLLTSTVMSVQEISIELGFTSQVVFAKFFKSKKNVSPTDFRKRLA